MLTPTGVSALTPLYYAYPYRGCPYPLCTMLTSLHPYRGVCPYPLCTMLTSTGVLMGIYVTLICKASWYNQKISLLLS